MFCRAIWSSPFGTCAICRNHYCPFHRGFNVSCYSMGFILLSAFFVIESISSVSNHIKRRIKSCQKHVTSPFIGQFSIVNRTKPRNSFLEYLILWFLSLQHNNDPSYLLGVSPGVIVVVSYRERQFVWRRRDLDARKISHFCTISRVQFVTPGRKEINHLPGCCSRRCIVSVKTWICSLASFVLKRRLQMYAMWAESWVFDEFNNVWFGFLSDLFGGQSE